MHRAAMIVITLAVGCSSSGGDNSSAEAFVGTWARSGMVTTMCSGAAMATQTDITGTLVITLGSGDGAIVGTDSVNACVTHYSVSGKVASAAAGQTCMFMNARGGQSTSTGQTHTLTLSSDGKTISEAGMAMVMAAGPGGANVLNCTSSSAGTFTKQ